MFGKKRGNIFSFLRVLALLIMDNKNLFLDKVSELFIQNGAKTVTMDDIAKEFSMSKKTLYQQYKNKEEVLKAVLNFQLSDIVFHMKEVEKVSTNPIERMLLREKNLQTVTQSNKTVFLRQLHKYYPVIFNEHILEVYSKISVIILHNIQIGRNEGYYRKDFNEAIYVKFMMQLFLSMEGSSLFKEEAKNPAHLCQSATEFFLCSILTPKGTEILTQLKTKYEELA